MEELEIRPQHRSGDVLGVTYAEKNGLFQAEIEDGERKFDLGSFASSEQAATARDMEVLRLFGSAAAKHVNHSYTVLRKRGQSEVVELKAKGQTVAFAGLSARPGQFVPMAPGLPADPALRAATPFVETTALPHSTDINKKWQDKISMSYISPAAFVYEISFHHANALGINLRPHYMHYPGGLRALGCCIVFDAGSTLSAIVRPGDILLKLNEIELVSNDEEFQFENVTNLITSSTSTPRVIRFMRIAGMHFNLLPSPAEVMLLMKEGNPSAKFTCTASESTSAHAVSIQLVQLDNQAPMFIKRLMKGEQLVWEASATPQLIPKSHSIKDTEGVFKDRNKWIAVINVDEFEGQRPYFLGKFESEDEAIGAFIKAQEDVKRYGSYSAKRIKRNQVVVAAPRVPIPTVPIQYSIPYSYSMYSSSIPNPATQPPQFKPK